MQRFLDQLPYRCEEGHPPAARALREGKAHCFDGALLAAAALGLGGYDVGLVDLCATRDDDHVLCVYTWRGRFGAVAKSNFPGLRFREPVHRTIRELVLSYYEFYFNLDREKTLRSYSSRVRLPEPRRLDWHFDDDAAEQVVSMLVSARHSTILERGQERRLRSVDERLFKSQLVGVNSRGLAGNRS